MKLNKEICKKCKTKGNKTFQPVLQKGNWTAIDEERWNRGKVFCLVNQSVKEQSWNLSNVDEIPDDCPYKLEHTVLEQNETE